MWFLNFCGVCIICIHIWILSFVCFCLQAEALAEKNQRDLESRFEQEEKRVRIFDFINTDL